MRDLHPFIFILLISIGFNGYVIGMSNLEEPIYLTSFIDIDQIELAREKALVKHPEIKNITSYAGYLTVNKNYNANSFFWFFPSQNDPRHDPVLLWFQGNTGQTASIPIFRYNGPFSVTKEGTLKFREYSFISNHSVIYIDNPIGTGYSFTEDDEGYARSFDQIGSDLVVFLKQFFTIFSDFQDNDFFIGGDSNGGRYTITTAAALKRTEDFKVNLKGLVLGNPYIDPVQIIISDYLYNLGLIDEAQRKDLRIHERKLVHWREKTYPRNKPHSKTRADLPPPPMPWDYALSYTGLEKPMSILKDESSEKIEENKYYQPWMNKTETRIALHVGNAPFVPISKIVMEKLANDLLRPVTHELEDLLESHEVLLYHGQLDMLFPYQPTIDLIKSLRWSAVREFKRSTRKIWRVDGKVAGYARTAGNLIELLVRNAGHVVPDDQLYWACDMLKSFTHAGARSFVNDYSQTPDE